jgi:hypothetical protein
MANIGYVCVLMICSLGYAGFNGSNNIYLLWLILILTVLAFYTQHIVKIIFFFASADLVLKIWYSCEKVICSPGYDGSNGGHNIFPLILVNEIGPPDTSRC